MRRLPIGGSSAPSEDDAYVVALQRVLLDLLQVRTEGQTLNEVLDHCLDVLLAAPFAALLPRGGIFLRDEATGHIRLVVSRAMAPALLISCANVAPGVCLCGRAAANGTIMFAADLDRRHEIRYDGIQPHGHYAVPLRLGPRVLGVIIFYLPAGHQPRSADHALLEAAGAVIATLIERCRAEEVLRGHAAVLTREVEQRTSALAGALAVQQTLRTESDLARAEAERANRAMDRFISTLSHELRAPLMSFMGYTDVLEACASDPAQVLSIVARLREAGGRLTELVEDCLDYGLVRSGRLRFSNQVLRASAMLEEVGRVARLQAQGRAVEVRLLPVTEPIELRGDVRRIRQVLVNLAVNAVKYTDHGVVELGMESHPLPNGGVATRWTVRDSGLGMDAEAVEQVFEPFRRVGGEDRPGHGLGLAISRRIARAMGGDILVQSEPGHGSTFTLAVVLPHEEATSRSDGPGA